MFCMLIYISPLTRENSIPSLSSLVVEPLVIPAKMILLLLLSYKCLYLLSGGHKNCLAGAEIIMWRITEDFFQFW